MIPGLFIDTFSELAQNPAGLTLLVRQLALIESFSLFAVEFALELIGSSKDTKKVH